MEMIWSVSPLGEYVGIQVAGNGQTSLSIGVISGKPRMVDTPYHQVMLLSDVKCVPAVPPPSFSLSLHLSLSVFESS
ncbi:hypothetical protein VYU27_010013 [Nannochloropsis oceanica]